MRKSERHRVKRDELVTVFERIHVYIEENLRRVALMAAIGIGLLLAILGVWSWLDGREQSASFLLARMMEAYRAPLAARGSPDGGGALPGGVGPQGRRRQDLPEDPERLPGLRVRRRCTGPRRRAILIADAALREHGEERTHGRRPTAGHPAAQA